MSEKRTIWKYDVRAGEFQVALPHGSRVLAVQTQDERPVFWALVDPHGTPSPRTFRVVLTGGRADVEKWNYIGTFQLDVGMFVGHLFEKPEWLE